MGKLFAFSLKIQGWVDGFVICYLEMRVIKVEQNVLKVVKETVYIAFQIAYQNLDQFCKSLVLDVVRHSTAYSPLSILSLKWRSERGG